MNPGIVPRPLAYTLVLVGVFAASQPLSAQAAQADCELPRGEPVAAMRPAVDSLLALARAARSDALVVLHDGRVVAEWYSEAGAAPIQTMSATKSIVGLAVGQLLDRGHLESLGQTIASLYPQWAQGRKRDITLRMILSHTSGIQNVPNAGAEIYPAPNALELALAAELTADPGTEWSYNNKAVNLLAGVFQEAAGRPMDQWIYEDLFAPLCIDTRAWYEDAAGIPHAMAGVELTPLELARIGQLMLQEGRWNGRRVVSPEWILASTTPSQTMQPRSGLLWWLLPAPGDTLRADSDAADVYGYYAEGYLGNYLVVLPSQRLVVVRMKGQAPDFERPHAMPGFATLVRGLFADTAGARTRERG